MAQSLSKKERQARKMMRNALIVLLSVICIISILVITTKGDTNGGYTAEQMAHDHDGDGIPDH